MNELDKVAEAYSIASIIATQVIEKNGLNKGDDKLTILNKLIDPLSQYIGANYDKYKNTSSLSRTDWSKYKKNMEDLITLAEKLANEN